MGQEIWLLMKSSLSPSSLPHLCSYLTFTPVIHFCFRLEVIYESGSCVSEKLKQALENLTGYICNPERNVFISISTTQPWNFGVHYFYSSFKFSSAFWFSALNIMLVASFDCLLSLNYLLFASIWLFFGLFLLKDPQVCCVWGHHSMLPVDSITLRVLFKWTAWG